MSALNLPYTGYTDWSSGNSVSASNFAFYWTSDTGAYTPYLVFFNSYDEIGTYDWYGSAWGLSVRCIVDQ